MQAYLTLVRRELSTFFVSLTGYIIIAAVLLLIGLSFVNLIEALNGDTIEMPITEMLYNTQYFWLILLLAAPVITMRTFALEKASGTYETLMTAPVGDLQVVLAKFTGALVFYMVMWLPLLGCLFIVRHYTNDPNIMDPAATAGTFLGILLIGCVYMSLGVYSSSLTQSQPVAAMVSLAFGISLFLIGFVALRFPNPSTLAGRVFAHISMIEHMRDFARGVVDTRYLTFYLSLTFFFLFLTLKSVESRRWK